MKTSKRKRSSTAAKAVPVVEASSAETVALPAITLESTEQQPAAAVEVIAEAVAEVIAEVVAEVIAAAADGKPAGDPLIVLAANCSVKDAAALKTSLCAVAKDSAAVTVDVRSLERIDTATMQLLCALVRDRSSRNQSVKWLGESQALQDAARLLGVRALLGFADANGVAA